MPNSSTLPANGPLSSWRFRGDLRHYQADVLERVDVEAGPLHIVAPPGSGKTLLGLVLAARRGSRTLVLAPTLTIRSQWARTAESLVPTSAAQNDVVPSVSESSDLLGDLTVATYQALSVLQSDNLLSAVAAQRWLSELESDGRTPEAAREWLDSLRETNPAAFRSGVARRSRTLRRHLAREDPDVLASALHPNALALIDRLVTHGVETIVLDECHHLLDHWALVVATLVGRIRSAGREPLLIGLTATLPSPDDASEYDNYMSLLGTVDYEVPIPAVVREGNLAPYRDLVRFVEPTAEELAFLEGQATGLAVLVRLTFANDAGVGFLGSALQPALAQPEPRTDLEPPPAAVSEDDEIDARLAMAFAADFAGCEAVAAMLATVSPQHPLVERLPAVARRPPTTDEMLRVLARYCLDAVLPDPLLKQQWERIRRTLADFGYALTDRGVRRTRDPIDTMLASSLAKDRAACDILRLERGQLGTDRLRALVVTDFAEHGNKHGGLVAAAGALRTFEVIATDAATRGLRAILVTGGTARIAARDAEVLIPALMSVMGVPVAASPRAEASAVCELYASGAHASTFVEAASALLTSGTIQVVVGTRGLFGEGWDCPAVNTLIDLTAVATASATQQLRGRTLRLDPQWPEKVAHNWSVTALLPPDFPLSAAPDARRLWRKHARLWGLDRDEPMRIVRGVGTVMGAAQRVALEAVVRADASSSVTALDELTETPARAITRDQWRIGEPYVDTESVSALVARRSPAAPMFRTSRPVSETLAMTLGGMGAAAAGAIALAALAGPTSAVIVGVVLIGGLLWLGAPLLATYRRTRAHSARFVETHARIAAVLWESLRRAGQVSDRPAPVMVVAEEPASEGRLWVSVTCPDASATDQRTLAAALSELFGPVRTPRFLIETGRGGRTRLERVVLRTRGAQGSEHFLSVPSAVGRKAADAAAFAASWEREIGPCILRALDHPDGLALVARARRGTDKDAVPMLREQWH
ncbi:DEAD/DEAH box helicase family protein [Microbacterium lacus]|uniref:DEAD/DEAH box helicase family protein n=1 Tax=Microbacterium lacus TaxID=415217 RepID=UPI00384E70B6